MQRYAPYTYASSHVGNEKKGTDCIVERLNMLRSKMASGEGNYNVQTNNFFCNSFCIDTKSHSDMGLTPLRVFSCKHSLSRLHVQKPAVTQSITVPND